MFVSWNYAGLVGEFGVILLLRKSGSPWHCLPFFSEEDHKHHRVRQKQLKGGRFLALMAMKGIFKGFKYITQIFENEKEQEIVIGNPTDVKHVAHIGWDGPSANTPSWMNEFKGTPEVSSMSSNGEVKAQSPNKDSLLQDITEMSKPSGDPLDCLPRHSSNKPKQSRRGSNSMDSPTRDPNKPRRHKNSGSFDSPTRESSKRAIRLQNSNLGLDSTSQDPHPPKMPKKSRGKTSKGTSSVVSNRSSKSKGPSSLTGNNQYSDPGSGQGVNNNGTCPNSVLEMYEDGKECDAKSRGIRAL
ncbi:unnamed protein product [Camellia sinensis]